jgi:chromosome segregation ATPase
MTTAEMLRPSNPWAGPILSAGISGAFGVIILIYGSQINSAATAQANIASSQSETIRAQSTELQEHDRAIAQLRAADQNKTAEEERISKAISDIQTMQGQLTGVMTTLKDATDETARAVQGLQTTVGSINDIIRPARNPNIR